MNVRTLCAALAVTLIAFNAHAAGDDADTIKRLSQTKHSLVDGIRQAEAKNGKAISAKFEFEDGKLWLSVYTAKDGLSPDAEHNTLLELKGEPGSATWAPAIEVFEDKAHLTRSAMHLTLMQVSRTQLAELVTRAAATQTGIPYSAIPAVKNGKAVLVVKFASPDGSSRTVDVDLR